MDKEEYTVTSKKGLTIPVHWNSYSSAKLNMNSTATAFNCDWTKSSNIAITPIRAGNGTITIQDTGNAKDKVTVKIKIDHSAVYDNTSYPKVKFADVLRYPSNYKGSKIQIVGRVLQKMESGSEISLRVGTGGYRNYDDVFYVTYNKSDIAASIIEDDIITVFGTCTGTHTYTTIMGASVTIPSMKAEQILFK